MARTRISTTVDAGLLARFAVLVPDFPTRRSSKKRVAALLARDCAADIDAAYVAYEVHPLDDEDEWGDLASFRASAGSS